MADPVFDPSLPYEEATPKFNPNEAYEAVTPPRFDPSAPFESYSPRVAQMASATKAALGVIGQAIAATDFALEGAQAPRIEAALPEIPPRNEMSPNPSMHNMPLSEHSGLAPLLTPLVPLRQAFSQGAQLGYLGEQQPEGALREGMLTAADVVTSTEDLVGGVMEFMTSPVGLSTLGLGAAPGAARALVSAGFAADMANHAAGNLKEFQAARSAGDTVGQAEALSRGLQSLGMAGLAGSHFYKEVHKATTGPAGAIAKAIDAEVRATKGTVNPLAGIAQEAPLTASVVARTVPTSTAPPTSPTPLTTAALDSVKGPVVETPTPTPAAAAGEFGTTPVTAGEPPAKAPVPQPEPVAKPESERPLTTEPELIGMGGAISSEFAPARQTATGIKNAAVDAERQARGQPPIVAPARLANPVVWDSAMARIDREPGWQDLLIEELKEKPRTPSAEEIVALDHRYVDLQNEFAKATRDGEQHYKDGFEQGVQEARERVAFYEGKLAELEQVARNVGTEWGRSGQMRQRLMNEDFSLAAMEARTRAAKGFEPLTDTERAEVAALHQKLTAAETKATEVEAQANERIAMLEAQKALAEARAAAQPTPYEPRVLAAAEKFASFMDKKGADALTRIKARLGRTSAGIDPTILSDVGILGAAKITRGVVDFAKWTEAMTRDLGEWFREHAQEAWDTAQKVFAKENDTFHKGVNKAPREKIKKAAQAPTTTESRAKLTEGLTEAIKDGATNQEVGRYARKLAEGFIRDGITEIDRLTNAVHGVLKTVIPDITRTQSRDAWTNYGQYRLLNKDAIKVRLRELSTEGQKLSTIERLESGQPGLKTGQERQAPTDAARRMQRRINELKKALGITTTDPATQLRSALEAIKTRNRNRIADLRFENSTGTRIVRGRRVAPSDAETIAQRAEIERLKQENEAIFGSKELTDEQRLERAIGAAERAETAANERLARAEKGDFSKTEGADLPPSATLDEIRARTAALREETQRLRAADTAYQEAKRTASQAKQLGEIGVRIEEVARQINEGEIAAKKASGPVLPELAAKRAELAELNKIKQQLRNAAKPKKSADEIAIQSLKTRMATEKAELERRLREGDFSPRRGPARELPLDTATANAKAEVQLLRDEFKRQLAKHEYEQKSRAEKIWLGSKEALNLSRAILTSWDVSAVFRQGGFIAFGNPVRAARALKPMFEALASEKRAAAIEQEIQSRPNAKLYAQAKLFLAPREGGHLTGMEEAFMSRLASKIPGVAGSQRAYITFLNKLRADTFDALHDSLASRGGATAEELKAIANYVNVATGRGNLAKSAAASEFLSTVFFSPRLVASRFQLITNALMGFRQGGATSTRVRLLVAREYAKYLMGLATVYGLGSLAGATIDTNAKSSDFGKLKFGNTRVDPMSGLAQTSVLLSRIITGEKTNLKGKTNPIVGKVPYGKETLPDVLATFLRTKLSPLVSTAIDWRQGQNVVGEPVSAGTLLPHLTEGGIPVPGTLLTPLSFRDILEVMEEQGVPRGTAIGILSLFGMGVQNYDAKKKTP